MWNLMDYLEEFKPQNLKVLQAIADYCMEESSENSTRLFV
jgi:hypothetical protein